jgi:hypothetical protein
METEAAGSSRIITFGILSPEGWAIEPLSKGRLVFWDGEEKTVAPTIEHAGRVYSAANLDAALAQKLRFPQSVAEAHSCPEVIHEIGNLVSAACGLNEQSGFLASGWVVSDWLADVLPGLPPLCLLDVAGNDDAVLRIFEGLCRSPLRVATASVETLLALPEGLHPTLLLAHPEDRQVRSLKPFTREGGASIFTKGRLVDLRCSLVVTTDHPLDLGASSLCLTPTNMVRRRFCQSEIDEITERLRPGLLRYRLEHCNLVRQARFDVPDFGVPTRVLAHTLGGVLAPYPHLQRQVVEGLRSRDEDQKISAAERPATAVTEVLMVSCHQNKSSIFVGEIARLANGIRFARGVINELTSKAVGALIRTQLGLSLTRKSQGYELILNAENRLHIHRSARALYARVSADPTCGECVKEQATKTEIDVHEVHRASDQP